MTPPPGDHAVGEVYYTASCSGCHGERASAASGRSWQSRLPRLGLRRDPLPTGSRYGRAGTADEGLSRAATQGPTQLTPSQIADVIAYLRYLGTRDDLPVLRTGARRRRPSARELLQGNCAACHGADGEGASGPQLNNPAFLRTASDGFLAATIVLGRGGTAMQPMVHGGEGLGQIAPENVAGRHRLPAAVGLPADLAQDRGRCRR